MTTFDRYALHGPEALSDVELLALALGGARGRPASTRRAQELLRRLGGAEGLSRASLGALLGSAGLPEAHARRLHASFALARRGLRALGPAPATVHGPEDAWLHLSPVLADRAEEELHALYLGARGRLLAHRCLTRGSDRHTVVDPRQVFRPAIELGAVSVVVAHNHPSGDPSPSGPDREVTRRLAQAGRVLGVGLVDHLILAGERFTSLAECGELPTWSREPQGWTAEDQ